MKKVAVFGNAGAGKSTLARRLAELTQLPWCPLDLIQYRTGGGAVPHDEYLNAHAQLLQREAWIIDGYGCVKSAWQRFAAADTLIHIDLPSREHKRVHHLKSAAGIEAFLDAVLLEFRRG